MKYIPSIILLLESLLTFYSYFFRRSMFMSSPFELILGIVFLILAQVILKNPNKKAMQWGVILFSLFFGPGGFLGGGGIAGILLAVAFIFVSKEQKKLS